MPHHHTQLPRPRLVRGALTQPGNRGPPPPRATTAVPTPNYEPAGRARSTSYSVRAVHVPAGNRSNDRGGRGMHAARCFDRRRGGSAHHHRSWYQRSVGTWSSRAQGIGYGTCTHGNLRLRRIPDGRGGLCKITPAPSVRPPGTPATCICVVMGAPSVRRLLQYSSGGRLLLVCQTW
jgi:hypothetical protein